MSTNTTNYNLVKPATTDFYDIAVQNGNMDAIDAALKGLQDKKLGVSGGNVNITTINAKAPAYAVTPTETLIQSGFVAGFSGYIAHSTNQEGKKFIQLNMTKSSDLTAGSTTFYTLASMKPKRNVIEPVDLLDALGNIITTSRAYVLFDTNGVMWIYATGTLTNTRNFTCILAYD